MSPSRATKTVDEDLPSHGVYIDVGRHSGEFRGSEIRAGEFRLKPDSIESLRERGFTSDEIHAIVGPRRTLARRKEQSERLTLVESDRVLRLEHISDMADRVFGNHEKAQRWLRKESRALEKARPIDLLRSETGAHIVEQELHRIDYGMFA
jgi:putative toxin-antitoxin system antitoxin component (TIGR02293 family)